ncbi:hypothetical protein SLEP1_g4801 [Rubroshorea leprosula]|uniref:CCHC-type domain-containing protein n=1 Tax=Rubroshorea leprosula TaxID=152421 RepID=A0AAV5HYT4_9ROSI|nr:hypothetical protein SLEP1_g4801 [Rubroshorea leprosula]
MKAIWDQLALSKPTFNDTADIGKYIEYRDKMRLIQFLMALTNDFEPCRASLLHQSPLPTLDSALSRLLSNETRLGLLKPQRDTTVDAAINKFPSSKRGQKYCRHCNKYEHALYECSLIECHKCKQKDHIAPNCTSLPQRSDQWKTQSKPNQSSKPVVVATTANEDTSVHLSNGNLETLLRQMISSSSTSTALPTIPEDVSSADIAPRTNEIENPPVTSSSSHPTWSYKEAFLDPLWQQAMKEELQALEKTSTWDLVDLPPDKTLVGCKWVYKIKTHSNGSVEHYKACLMAKGFTQEYGIDYEETFAPVARLTTVRSLLAIAAVRKWKLFQMDVKNSFLNGDLENEVYMKPPPGLTPASNKVCRLRRALHGLKQSPRAWFAKFSSTVSEFGFNSSPHDTTLFVRKSAQGMVLLLIYVDDMIITEDDVSGIDELKQFLSHRFEMKDLVSLSYFLGLEVTSSDAGYLLSQMKYASDLISKANLTDSKNVSTPLEPNVKLTPLDGSPLLDPSRYQQLVGSLVYLTMTRPDIAYAVHVVSQFMAALHSTHYATVLRIIRHVKGTLFHGLHFSAHSSLVVRAYSDADWAGDLIDRRSTIGYCLFLGNSLISWRSKKQAIPSRSSTEAEYRALGDTTSELFSLRWLLEDMGVSQPSFTDLYCDNQSALQIAHNDVFHERTKHIEVDCHFIRHHVAKGTVHLVFIGSTNQPADLFTMAHFPGRFRTLLSKLKLVSFSPP